ncbi:hypothetical protein [Morganella morganii]|uniref:hypothetical protein n=1 Tax=Morganella morganii TaxID=582 RepID=UPI00195CDAAF|nr:hypothetical protein [Morganella morganii]MBM7211583.1 hypothetical protein [Morganella morganii]MBN4016988.1 hypothetical protein [Morganella morganii]QSB61417.1 hypothetical protein JW291_13870 [Morganella morganii]QSB89222.1 hypothetical protein JW297_11970 [Morganella morganii]
MILFNDLMISGSSLEKRKLYRRAAEQYNKAFHLAVPGNGSVLSKQEKTSKQAMERCLIKPKIKIAEGL